jgi:hypothetical protein
MKKTALFIFLAALLVSCSSKPAMKPVIDLPLGTSYTTYQQDQASCNFETNRAMLNYRYDTSTVWGAAMGRSASYRYAEDLFFQCMQSKGYKVVHVLK